MNHILGFVNNILATVGVVIQNIILQNFGVASVVEKRPGSWGGEDASRNNSQSSAMHVVIISQASSK